MILTVDRAFDNQRLHFTALQNEAAERHFADKRDIARATYETNVAQQSEKQDRELKAKLDEISAALAQRQQPSDKISDSPHELNLVGKPPGCSVDMANAAQSE